MTDQGRDKPQLTIIIDDRDVRTYKDVTIPFERLMSSRRARNNAKKAGIIFKKLPDGTLKSVKQSLKPS